ncbi:MAG TPA: LysM peptidoglycan-binding domain-containing protein [Gammaproteobacteria bacterium]|jgi:LysM repeat protein|nr:LysM peptidoglycan-binding domain-containing protein [Gammaproteobacteria bacterium]
MNNPFSAVRILLAVFAIVFVVSGCTTAKPTEAEAGVATAAAPAPSTDTSADSDTSAESTDDSASDSSASSGSTGPAPISRYIVQSGDHLWGISGQAQVYGDSYQWPLLYKRNRDNIYDPDLIYPGQVLHIDREASEQQIQLAIDHAKTRGAWALGVVEKADIDYLMLAL